MEERSSNTVESLIGAKDTSATSSGKVTGMATNHINCLRIFFCAHHSEKKTWQPKHSPNTWALQPRPESIGDCHVAAPASFLNAVDSVRAHNRWPVKHTYEVYKTRSSTKTLE